MSTQVKALFVTNIGLYRVRMLKKKPVIFNTGYFFCFKSNVSNLYNNDVIIHKKKLLKVPRTVLFVNEFT